jgi:hypothetical protein
MSNDVEIPFACDLSAIDAELRERHSAAWEVIRAQMQQMIEVDSGFMFRYPASEAMFSALAAFIAGERLCCPFFDFGVSVPHGEDVIWLSLTGREGVKDFLRAELNF